MAELIDYPDLCLRLNGGTSGAANDIWRGYQHIHMEDKVRRKERFAREARRVIAYAETAGEALSDENFYTIYDAAVSIFQGKTGEILNKLTAKIYSALFSTHGSVLCEVKQPIGDRKLDLVFILPKGNLYVSVASSSAERKKTDWRVEAQDIEACHRGAARKWFFIGLFFSDKSSHSFLQDTETREKLQGHVGQLCRVVCARDQKDHAQVLSTVLHDFI